jgi:plastocyanin
VKRLVVSGALAALLTSALPVRAATVDGVVRHRGTGARDAVIYLEKLDGPAPRPAPGHVVMDQKNLAFAPRVLPVVAGTTVDFTNSDDIQHNVFTPSRSAGAFDLGTYNRGESRSVTMTEPGEVLVLCNIHMEMEARIIVVRDPFFAVTDRDGRYRLPDVPPGRYAVKLWRASWLPLARTVEVIDGAPVTLDLEL